MVVVVVGGAPLGLVLLVRAGGALLGSRLDQGGAVKTLDLHRPVFQLDARGEGRSGGGRLQEASVVQEAEDSAALLGEGVEDETVLCRQKTY